MDTYSDSNSAPPEYPEQSAGSSVSSRLQDEYEELLKYAVVVPKIDVDDLPRVLADSKRSLTQSHRPQPVEQLHTSESDSDDGVAAAPQRIVTVKQGIGRIISPARKKPNRESDIQTITPRTKVSPSQPYRHQPRARDTDSDSDVYPRRNHGNRNNHAAPPAAEESETESEAMFEMTLQKSYEAAPSQSDLTEIERKMDMWSRQLNSNIMDEISRLRIKLVESSRHLMQTAESRHAGALNTLHNELEGVKELLQTYEVSIERKDGVISNLTRSLQNQKEKLNTVKAFADWKIQFAAKKQEGYGMRLAAQHHNKTIKKRCWRMWHMIIVEKWRRRVEKACQAKAQEVCIALTNDYETKLQSLDEKYMSSREEVMTLHRERDNYEENMKKAFMRGVCALNMEAMNMFHEPDADTDRVEPQQGYSQTTLHSDRENMTPPPRPHSEGSSRTSAVAQSKIFSSTTTMPSPLGSKSYTVQHGPAYTSTGGGTIAGSLTRSGRPTRPQVGGGRKLTATVTASGKPGKPGTARLMGQQKVLVERHDNATAGSPSMHQAEKGRTSTNWTQQGELS